MRPSLSLKIGVSATYPKSATSFAEGREAFERGDAVASRQAFESALAESETGEVFEGLARALHLAGDYAGSIAPENTERIMAEALVGANG